MNFKIRTNIKIDNSLIVILFFFQYGLLVPINLLVGGQYPIIFFTFFLLFLTIKKKCTIPIGSIILFIVPLSLLLIKLPFEYDIPYGNTAFKMIVSYLTIGVAGIILGSIRFSTKEFLQNGFKIAWINFAILFIIPFTPLYGNEVNYMRFGYSLLPTIVFSFVFMIKDKKRGSLLLFIMSFIELLIFGARGAMLTFIFFAFVFLFVGKNVRTKVKIYMLCIIPLLFLVLKYFLPYINIILSKYNMYSYSVTKYLNLLNGNSLSSTSSGRDYIYNTAIKRIESSPWFGSPINSCLSDAGYEYYHNIIFDILVPFGIPIFLIFLTFIGVNFYRAIKYNDEMTTIVFLILFSVSVGRLLISSSLWQRPEFWMFLGFCVSFHRKNEIKYLK